MPRQKITSKRARVVEPKGQETPFIDLKLIYTDENLADLNESASNEESPKTELETSPGKSLAIDSPSTPTEEEIFNIYEDVSKLWDIERYLNIVYKPFYCMGCTSYYFNLHELDLVMENARFEPDRHLAVFLTRTSPFCTVKIYPNGNIYCQSFNRDGAREGLSKVLQELRNLGYYPRVQLYKYSVVNATFSVPFHLNLRKFHWQNPGITEYDPKKLPFLMYKMVGTLVNIAIFPTGYVYVMFASSRSLIKLAIAHILPILYRIKSPFEEQSQLNLSSGDINYKVLWEKYFQDGNYAVELK
ncbi:TATA-box-binding protein-like 1 [Drosophila eugracilis]|uniref:TATA-box-binding protein-like 1 n=1 Tax=Drosophila eugracilis TaxID=29029 RepID=UPI001BDB6C08|nr:TATA-box-binding protein-like 1 [Drosophila eugracilis]